MSKSSEVFFQLGPRPAGPRNNTLVITTPYSPTDGYQRPEIKHGPATFVLDPLPGGHTADIVNHKNVSNGNIIPGIVLGNYAPQTSPKVSYSSCVLESSTQETTREHAHLQPHQRTEESPKVPVSKPEVSSVDILLGPRGSNVVNIKPEVGVVNKVESKGGNININISRSDNNGNPWLSRTKLSSVQASPPPIPSEQRRLRNQTNVVNVRTVVTPPPDSPASPPRPASPPLSMHSSGGEVRGRLTLCPIPPAFHDTPKPLQNSLPTVIGGSHHFRFSPSLTRRACRLQTVPEAPSNGQDGNNIGDIVGEEEEEEEEEVAEGGAVGTRNGDRSELFTSVVNFQLDRDRADEASLSRPAARHAYRRLPTGWSATQEEGARQVKPRDLTAHGRGPHVKSQESKVLQTQLDFRVKEELPPPVSDTLRVPLPADPSGAQPEVPLCRARTPPAAPLSGEQKNSPDHPTGAEGEPESEILDEPSPDAYDPRRRASYRISAISEDGFRAWTQNTRARGGSGGSVGSDGVGHVGGDVNGGDDSEDETPYMEKLKNVASRLKLSSRRQSTQAWRERVVGQPPALWRNLSGSAGSKKRSSLHDFGDVQDESDQSQWSEDRLDRVNEALSWIRRELLYMREQDQTLARYLITLRHDIQQVKLARSSAEHQEAIEDAAEELEEARHMAGHSDTPPEHFSTTLKQYGVTRMNINSRRFSVF